MPNYEFKRDRMKQQTRQVPLKTCWDGSVIPKNQVCPVRPKNYKGVDDKRRQARTGLFDSLPNMNPDFGGKDDKRRQGK